MAWELACPALQAIAMERARRAGNGSGGVECVARNTGKDRRIGAGQRYATKLLLSVGFWQRFGRVDLKKKAWLNRHIASALGFCKNRRP
ncbi:hypothetical protein Rmet_3273 [Cupriavidus metallidurans CH34]|jgi:hypothetical protein|uniref:Uncharacterized protein n=1 Tax=Cupriavidus metallidurans (strain ATCC 43123 / DSM 2839 / NBRC 102507 / CH34) TaxID=266264 RepID=Q1LI81_CUPMC|nr:hypothetical protein Rmet_3273 [Cupriavidus metallidurans CH34]